MGEEDGACRGGGGGMRMNSAEQTRMSAISAAGAVRRGAAADWSIGSVGST